MMVRKILLIRRKRDAQDLCPGYDDNVDVPIGCLVLDMFWYHMGVIYQWIVSFQKGGWSTLDHAETGNVKYPCLRAGEAFVLILIV